MRSVGQLPLRARHRHGSGVVAGYQPAGREADTYEVSYSEDQATFSRRDGSIATGLTIMVSAEDDAEIRRVSLTNLGSRVARDRAHVVSGGGAGAAGGRRRPPGVPEPVRPDRVRRRDRRAARHAPAALERRAADVGGARGDGRRQRRRCDPVRDRPGSIPRARAARSGRRRRSSTGAHCRTRVGAVLDPIFSLRRRVVIEPGETVHAIFATVVAESREQVLDLADKYRTPATFERARILAWTHAQVQLHHLGIDAGEAHLFQRLANRILYSDPSLRPRRERARRQPARGARHSGRTASPATCRSWSSASTNSTTSTSSASCCGRTSTGASSCSTSTS